LPTGKKAVSFIPYGTEPEVRVTDFELRDVRSSNGAISLRYVIPTMVVIRGVQYPIQVSLADRTLMKKGILIGRSFLREHGFLVDANEGEQYRYEVK